MSNQSVTHVQVRCFQIDGDDIDDIITVFAEDHGPRRGTITIRCFDKAWTAGWSGMGERNVLDFFASCDASYLLKNLVPHAERFETDIEGTIRAMKERVLRWRREGRWTKDEARKHWDGHLTGLNGDLTEWEFFSLMNDMPYECIEEVHRNKLTSNAEWMRDTIIPEIHKAIAKLNLSGVVAEQPHVQV